MPEESEVLCVIVSINVEIELVDNEVNVYLKRIRKVEEEEEQAKPFRFRSGRFTQELIALLQRERCGG